MFFRNIDFLFSYVFTGSFLNVPWPGIEPPTFAYEDDALTNWTIWPGLFVCVCVCVCVYVLTALLNVHYIP